MVNEMFWEADHPNASALLRKSNMIVCRSRQKLSTRYQADDLSRTTSSLSYRLPPAHSPPTQPLPPIPQGQISELVSIPEQHSAPSVEKWRSQVKVSRNEDGDSEQESPIIPKQRMETLADDLKFKSTQSSSVASWKVGDDSSTTSPITPFISPHASQQFDFQRHNPNEGKARVLDVHPALRSHPYYDQHRAPVTEPRVVAHRYELSDDTSTALLSLSIARDRITVADKNSASSPLDKEGHSRYYKRGTQHNDELKINGQVLSRTSSHQSSIAHSFSRTQSEHSEEANSPAESQRKFGGFSLFPLKSHKTHYSSANLAAANDLVRLEDKQVSMASNSGSSTGLSPRTVISSSAGYLSIDTCLEWKNMHKKAKKSSKVPPLLQEDVLERLKDRDHVRRFLSLSSRAHLL
jgi:hypothetical protein